MLQVYWVRERPKMHAFKEEIEKWAELCGDKDELVWGFDG